MQRHVSYKYYFDLILLYFWAIRLCPQSVEYSWLVNTTVSVSAEEIALSLNKRSWQTLGTQAIVVCKQARE